VRLVLLGPPGAGKGTQAARLADRFGVEHISTGDILRGNVAAGTPLGIEAKSYMDAGELVPDDVVVRMLVERLSSAGSGFILDGFPRTVAQAAALDEALGDRSMDLDAVLSFDIDREVVVRRISLRRTCPACHRAYNLQSSPPLRDEVCDVDTSPLLQREDDREDVVRRRMEVFEEQTAPVRAFYQGRGLVRPVDADGSEDQVFRRTVEALADVVGQGAR
jgi:adenylate kinase